jgi:hypothetical protein
MFSQRGHTCGPDALFTVLFDASALRAYFGQLLERPPARLLRSKDQLRRALGLAIQRYQKMHAAAASPSAGPALVRIASTNTGEAKEVLDILSECGPDDIGMRPGILKKVVQEIIMDDAFDVFEGRLPFRVASLPDSSIRPSAIKTDDVVALIFELDWYKPVPIESNSDNERNYRNWRGGARLNASRKTTAGHIVAFVKRGDAWYFADNEVGWLHKMRDQSFVPDHVIKGIKDDLGAKEFSPLILTALPDDADPDILHLNRTMLADNTFYTGSDAAGSFDESYGYLAGGEVHVIMRTPRGGTRRSVRMRRVRSKTRRNQ